MFAAFYTALQPALYSGIGKATESRSVNMLVYRTRESGVGGYMNQFAIRSLRDPFFRCSDQLCQAQVRPITEIIQPLSSLATLPSKSGHGSKHNILFRTVVSRYMSKVFQPTFPDSALQPLNGIVSIVWRLNNSQVLFAVYLCVFRRTSFVVVMKLWLPSNVARRTTCCGDWKRCMRLDLNHLTALSALSVICRSLESVWWIH